MNARATASPQQPVVEEARMARARVELTIATLPIAVWVNPTWAALTALPFTGLFPIFGTVAWWRIALILSLHVLNSFGAAFLYREARREANRNPQLWMKRLIGFQALISAEWGLLAWLLWVNGNSVNHVMIVMSMVAMLWAYAFSRAMHVGVYLAGVVPTTVLALTRLVFDGSDPAVLPLSLFLSVTFVFAFLFAGRARRYIETMLRTRFANDDLAVELRATRDDALRKRFEAEAANASKTTFLANMSHELRTPLNAILGFSELIAHETLGPIGTQRYREYATDINFSGTHLLSLINDILDVAKIESGKMDIEPRGLDPKATIEKALVVVAARAREKRQHLLVEVAPSGTLFADERALKQIVINLTSNAVKFTPEGGNIIVSGGPTADGGYELCVEDDGPGIPTELLERVFLPFNQVDNRYSRQSGGTGLGLSLVRGLAELHGGRAWIESDVGAGVRAYVYFPVGNHVRGREQTRLRA